MYPGGKIGIFSFSSSKKCRCNARLAHTVEPGLLVTGSVTGSAIVLFSFHTLSNWKSPRLCVFTQAWGYIVITSYLGVFKFACVIDGIPVTGLPDGSRTEIWNCCFAKDSCLSLNIMLPLTKRRVLLQPVSSDKNVHDLRLGASSSCPHSNEHQSVLILILAHMYMCYEMIVNVQDI